jgi:repressor LexA
MGLTRKQKEFFDFINEYISLHGHSPTQKEMKDHFQLKSFGSVQKYLQYLEKEGLLNNQ